MRFSLIIGTLNRSEELKICLNSLRKQTFKDFEIILIDQSTNEDTEKLVSSYKDMKILYEHVSFKGLSKARNVALKLAHGEYFALVDDDACYEENYLFEANLFLSGVPKAVLSGRVVSKQFLKQEKEKSLSKNACSLKFRRMIRECPSVVLLFPYSLYQKGYHFNENFGVGARLKACEETDLLLDAIDAGYPIFYNPKMLVVHPTVSHSFEIENDTELRKKENYAKGFGALIEKDRLVRKKNRLLCFEIEKRIKIYIKILGILGKKKQLEAKAELRGLKKGFEEYKQIYQKEGKQ